LKNNQKMCEKYHTSLKTKLKTQNKTQLTKPKNLHQKIKNSKKNKQKIKNSKKQNKKNKTKNKKLKMGNTESTPNTSFDDEDDINEVSDGDDEVDINEVSGDDDVRVTITQWPNGEIKKKTYSSSSKYKYHLDDDLPSIISYDEEGRIISKDWRKYDLLHRENDKPARETYKYITISYLDITKSDEDVQIVESQEFLVEGKYYRVDGGPTQICYFIPDCFENEKQVRQESWTVNDKLCRIVDYYDHYKTYPLRIIKKKTFFVDGVFQRSMEYDQQGNYIKQEVGDNQNKEKKWRFGGRNGGGDPQNEDEDEKDVSGYKFAQSEDG